MARYDVYISDVSYFSGKFEAYLRYRKMPYRRIHADAKTFATTIYQHTGMMQVPTVRCPNNQWLRDTTPMLDWFEREHEFAVPLVPPDHAAAFLHKLVEDFADEWLWQPAMYWRWMFKPSAKLLGRRIADEVMQTSPLPVWLAARYYSWRQKREWLYRDGMTSANRAHIANRYLVVLDALEDILTLQPFLSGQHPGLADFGLFGPFFRHFGMDPYPADIMRTEAPKTYAWLASLWAAEPSDHTSFSRLDQPQWQPIWNEINDAYFPYLAANSVAWQDQQTRFDLAIQGYDYQQMKTSQYRLWCLGQLQQQYQALSHAEQSQLTVLTPNIHSLLAGDIIETGIEAAQQLPVSVNIAKPKPLEQLRLMCFGTPREWPFSN